MKQISTDKAPAAAGPYSQGILTGKTLYVSGQLPVDPSTGTIPEGIETQARRTFDNISAIAEAAGMSLHDAVKVTVYIRDIGEFAAVNKVYGEYFSEPYPARSCVEVSGIPKGASMEIDAVFQKE